MPRYAGPPRNLDHKITLALDNEHRARADACAVWLDIPRAEAIRTGIDLLYITILSLKSTDSTLQPIGKKESTE